MAPSDPPLSLPLPFLAVVAAVLLLNTDPAVGCYTAIFAFGDSLTDTGNWIHLRPDDPVGRVPYGMTYFGHPTGRFSDGRIVLDFLAEAAGVPLVPPYLAGGSGEDFRRGANFAVGGATALDASFFRAKGINVNWTLYSLGAQIQEFEQFLSSSLNSSHLDFNNILDNSLFVMGEIGGNDYNQPFLHGRTIDEILTYVPSVIATISSAIKDLIKLGARTLVVPGISPLGCTPVYLTKYQSRKAEDYYDPRTGCIKWLNRLSKYHNRRLREELDRLRELHPNAAIIYADYYGATISIYQSPAKFGFNDSLLACCGGEGPYNVDPSVSCGFQAARVYGDPSSYVCWDGFHFTEAAYRIVAHGLLNGPFAVPPLSLSKTCLQTGTDLAQSLRVV